MAVVKNLLVGFYIYSSIHLVIHKIYIVRNIKNFEFIEHVVIAGPQKLISVTSLTSSLYTFYRAEAQRVCNEICSLSYDPHQLAYTLLSLTVICKSHSLVMT